MRTSYTSPSNRDAKTHGNTTMALLKLDRVAYAQMAYGPRRLSLVRAGRPVERGVEVRVGTGLRVKCVCVTVAADAELAYGVRRKSLKMVTQVTPN